MPQVPSSHCTVVNPIKVLFTFGLQAVGTVLGSVTTADASPLNLGRKGGNSTLTSMRSLSTGLADLGAGKTFFYNNSFDRISGGNFSVLEAFEEGTTIEEIEAWEAMAVGERAQSMVKEYSDLNLDRQLLQEDSNITLTPCSKEEAAKNLECEVAVKTLTSTCVEYNENVNVTRKLELQQQVCDADDAVDVLENFRSQCPAYHKLVKQVQKPVEESCITIPEGVEKLHWCRIWIDNILKIYCQGDSVLIKKDTKNSQEDDASRLSDLTHCWEAEKIPRELTRQISDSVCQNFLRNTTTVESLVLPSHFLQCRFLIAALCGQ